MKSLVASMHLRESLILSTGHAGDDEGVGTSDVLFFNCAVSVSSFAILQ